MRVDSNQNSEVVSVASEPLSKPVSNQVQCDTSSPEKWIITDATIRTVQTVGRNFDGKTSAFLLTIKLKSKHRLRPTDEIDSVSQPPPNIIPPARLWLVNGQLRVAITSRCCQFATATYDTGDSE